MRALLDTNGLVSTAIKPEGKPAQIFQRAATSYEMVCSEYILQELADVLVRPHIQKKYKDLVASERREHFIALVRSLATMVGAQTILDLVSDKEDNQIMACAVDSHADFLVTGDPHLLALQDYAGCKIVSPDQYLAILLGEEQTD